MRACAAVGAVVLWPLRWASASTLRVQGVTVLSMAAEAGYVDWTCGRHVMLTSGMEWYAGCGAVVGGFLMWVHWLRSRPE